MSSRTFTSLALGVVLVVLSSHWGMAFWLTVVTGVALIISRALLLPARAEGGVDRIRRGLNVLITVLLWVAFLLLPTTDLIPQNVFVPAAVMAGMWFLLDQPPGRLLDTLYAGLVALVAIVGLALTPAHASLTIPGALTTGILLLLAFGHLDLERIRDEMRVDPPSTGRILREWPLLLVFAALALLAPRPTLDDPEKENDLSGPLGVVAAKIGFSDSFRLGDFRKLKSDDTEVLRVRYVDKATNLPFTHEDGQRPDRPLLLLRGLGLDRFDGRGFSASRGIPATGRSGLALDRLRIRQQVLVLKYKGPELFAMGPVVAVNGVKRTADGMVRAPGTLDEGFVYAVESEVLDPRARNGLARLPSRHPDARYTALPSALDERFARTAREVIGAARGGYARARAIERFLTRDGGFAYTRADPNFGPEPLESFLFDTRAGHCEYYAAAMVVLLRTLGVPSRVAVGFRGGTYSERVRAYRVLAKNAHAWVEVFFETAGWVAFDPTPSESLIDVAPQSRTADPLEGGRELLEAPRSENAVGRDPRGIGRTLVFVGTSFLVAGSLALLWSLLSTRRRRRGAGARPRDQRSLRQRVCRTLRRAGSRPDERRALLERLDETSLEGEPADRVREVIFAFYRWRFGDRPLDPAERERAFAMLTAVERDLPSRRGG